MTRANMVKNETTHKLELFDNFFYLRDLQQKIRKYAKNDIYRIFILEMEEY